MSSVESKVEDLEEGEIEEDAFEDISDCSLSEALVMPKDLEHDSEVELLRKEALKSLPEEDEVTEEELYRLEALKSLLTNMESSEKISPAEEVRKKKRKHRKKSRRKKATKLESIEVPESANACEESKFLVETLEERTLTSQVDNCSSNMDFSDKENQSNGDMNLVTRSWYPKTDFALLNLSSNDVSNETKQQPRKSYGNDDFIIIPRILSVANNDSKSIMYESMPERKPVNPSLKLNRLEMPVTRTSMPISKLNCSVFQSAAHLSRYKKVSKHHIQKYPVIQPRNRFSLTNVKKGKYKLINNPSYSLKKSVNSSPAKTEKQNTLSRSVYSLNRVQNQPVSSKHSPFIIELDEDDSGKEDNGCVVPAVEPNLKRSSSKKKIFDKLPCSELPDNSIQIAENSFVDGSVAESFSSVIEEESNIERFKTLLTETGNEVAVDLQNDEEMPLSEVTFAALTTSRCDTPVSENNEHISPGVYSEEMTDGIEGSETIPDDVADRHAVSPGTVSEKEELLDKTQTKSSKMITYEVERSEGTSSSSYSRDINLSNPTEVARITPAIDEECDTNFLPDSNSIMGSEQLTEEPELLNVAACEEKYKCDEHFVIKEEPFDSESVENLSMTGNTEFVSTNGAEIDDSENLMVLQDAEADLIEIRARLLLNLGELEESIQKDESEKEKLNIMLKKLLVLKSSILKFENKIRAHQSKLSIHADTMQALFKDIVERTESCTQMKDVCFRVGMEIMGPHYKPPDVYENVIEEKIRVIDFSKYLPNFQEQYDIHGESLRSENLLFENKVGY